MTASAKLTGGSGHNLQHRVATSYLVRLLCRGVSPFISGGQILKINLEAGNLEWKTDDILVKGTSILRTPFNVAMQVKTNCEPIKSDTDFTDFIEKAYLDWNNLALFRRESDVLALVSSFQSRNLSRFSDLLDQVRATLTPEEFVRRLTIPKFIHNDVKKAWNVVREILAQKSDAEVWAFLRNVRVLLTDLDQDNGSHESDLLSLLATNCTEPDPIRVAQETWNRLQTDVGRRAGFATEYSYASLAEDLKQRHTPVANSDLDGLDQIARDTQRVLDGIRANIGNVAHVPRLELLSEITELIKKKRIILISGSSGSGKSALAKATLETRSSDSAILAFRSEEFAYPHLRAVPSFHGLSLNRIRQITAGFARRIYLVESVERLLESTSREAFTDFLREVSFDPNACVILTCRSYSVDVVRAAFLQPLNVEIAEVEVPPFSDSESNEVVHLIPRLKAPLESPGLRALLRYPFFLNMASMMDWENGQPLPTLEREFRQKVWKEVIQRVDQSADGMPLKRGKTYMACARLRAEKLTPFVKADDFDAGAVAKLSHDELLAHSSTSINLVAPSHDVLEDWALLQSISEEFEAAERRLAPLLNSEKPFPAMRRAFSKWIDEWIEADPTDAGNNVLEILRDLNLPQLWRDESFAAILRSPHAAVFITANRAKLLEENGLLLFRAIHLCRIVATKPHPQLGVNFQFLSGTRLPQGPAWAALVKLLQQNLGLIQATGSKNLVANFLEDWSRGIALDNPYPDGATEAALICMSQISDDYHDRNVARKFSETLVKIPKAGGEHFIQLVRSQIQEHGFDHYHPRLADLIITGLKCAPACRDLPDLVIECLNAYLGPIAADEDDGFGSGPSREVEAVFGLDPTIAVGNSSTSAYYGPYFQLLTHHPAKGLRLIIDTLNRCVAVFADPNTTREFMEIPDNLQLELPDGEKKNIWGSWRLWGGYRGITVMPYDLESALMALEAWLLLKIELGASDVEEILTEILRDTNNASLISVVASVACANPTRAGAAAYSVLTVPEFFEWDLGRKLQDPTSMEDILQNVVPQVNVDDQIYSMERKAARQQPHRAKSLEDLCRDLQQTPLCDKVFALLDRYRTEAMSVGAQDEANVVWLNIVNRMDFRTYREIGETSDGMRVMQAGPLPDEFNEHLQQLQPGIASNQRIMSLLHWGLRAFKRELPSPDEVNRWKEMLDQAEHELSNETEAPPDQEGKKFLEFAASYIAVVAIRDHLSEMSEDEIGWCEDIVTLAIRQEADVFDDFNSGQNHEMHGSRPAAFIISSLAKARPSEALDETLATALTHSVDQVRMYAIAGFRQVFTGDVSGRDLRVLGAFVLGGIDLASKLSAEKAKPWNARISHNQLVAEIFLAMRKRIAAGEAGGIERASELSLRDDSSYKFLPVISDWLASMPTVDAAQRFFKSNAVILRDLYTDKDNYNQLYNNGSQAFERGLARFVLQIPLAETAEIITPFAQVMEEEPDKCAQFIELLTGSADQYSRKEAFWNIWEQFANTLKSLPPRTWIRRDMIFAGVVKSLFLVVQLKEGVEDWHLISGEERRIIDLFKELPLSRAGVGLFLEFQLTTGRKVLESALVALDAKMAGHSSEVLTARNLGSLESILGPAIYATPAKLKRDPAVRKATLGILDEMINAGSTAAYFMRNDFATPYIHA